MLGNATKRATLRGSLALDCVSSSHNGGLPLKSFSTWLGTHHSPQSSQSSKSNEILPGISVIQSTRRYASTTRRSSDANTNEADFAQLPRFLRRQHLQAEKPDTSSTVTHTRSKNLSVSKPVSSNTGSAPKAPRTFRSKHYDPGEATPKSEMRLLEPYTLSSRLKKLCDAGKMDEAVDMLKNAPLDAQNTQVWNTLIWEALKVNRYQLAYQLFVDMKRRGFSPTSRTFQTFFNGLARIEDWSIYPKQLTNARSLYDGFQRHIASVKRADPGDPGLTPESLAGYIRILGNAGEYQEIFDVYYEMDQSGPMAPTKVVWTAMFQAISSAKNSAKEGGAKVAADARLLWNQMSKASKKNSEVVPDSHTVSAALIALSDGNKMDHDLGFRIISEYYGLVAEGAATQAGSLPLGPESFNTILQFCNRTKNHEYALKFFQQLKKRGKAAGGVSILDRLHMEEVLKADLAISGAGLGYHALDTLEWMLRQEITRENGPKIRPSLTTYNLVMQACWRSADWSSAVRTFELMTGYHAHDFMDGSIASAPRLDVRGGGRNLQPTVEIMSSMIRTAYATKNRADMRQALRIACYIGLDEIMRTKGPSTQHETRKAVKHRALFGKKLAAAVLETSDYVLADNGKYAKPVEAAKWRSLARQAKSLASQTIPEGDV